MLGKMSFWRKNAYRDREMLGKQGGYPNPTIGVVPCEKIGPPNCCGVSVRGTVFPAFPIGAKCGVENRLKK